MAELPWLREMLNPDGASRRLSGRTARPAAVDPRLQRPRLFINGRFVVQQATGVQRVAGEITRQIDAMAGRGEVTADVVLMVPPGPWVQELALRHIPVEVVGRRTGVLWEQMDLPIRARNGTLLCLGNSAPALSLLRRDVAVAVMIHDVSFLDHPGAYTLRYRLAHRWMLPLVMQRARRIFTVSQTECERLTALSPAAGARLAVAPNGGWSGECVLTAEAVGAGGAEAAPDALPTEPFGLYVGSLSHRKNFGRTLAAAIRLAREDGLHFVFVGASGHVLRQPDRPVPPDVADRIHFLGQINDAQRLSRIYRKARVMLFPSLYEACPLPPVEAAHFGCPVVVSNIAPMWERCGTSAVYCDPLSIDSLVRAVRSVLDDSPHRTAMIAAGRAMAASHRWDEQAALLYASLPVPTAG
ncbi:glycosyltransferase family 4 protein [Novosphingobium gossypii]|uniref:glycosyltransferase family 4 protein n=1 Tax=Novosphingobium gossypii TaxID=1604774 RepID=UPI003D1D3D65